MNDDDSAQRLCRTPTDHTPSIARPNKKRHRMPWTPPPEWRALFRAEATQATLDEAVAYAASYAHSLAAIMGRRSPGTVEEMVQDAIGDTFRGRVRWDPSRCSLAMHLKGVLRSRIGHELDRADGVKHSAIDAVSDQRMTDAIAIDSAPSASGHTNRSAQELTVRLRELAKDDEPVLQLIDCYRDGITERRRVCSATGMTVATFHNADRRLKRLAKQLPDDLCTAALGAMAREER
jgi:hypothetical protein